MKKIWKRSLGVCLAFMVVATSITWPFREVDAASATYDIEYKDQTFTENGVTQSGDVKNLIDKYFAVKEVASIIETEGETETVTGSSVQEYTADDKYTVNETTGNIEIKSATMSYTKTDKPSKTHTSYALEFKSDEAYGGSSRTIESYEVTTAYGSSFAGRATSMFLPFYYDATGSAPGYYGIVFTKENTTNTDDSLSYTLAYVGQHRLYYGNNWKQYDYMLKTQDETRSATHATIGIQYTYGTNTSDEDIITQVAITVTSYDSNGKILTGTVSYAASDIAKRFSSQTIGNSGYDITEPTEFKKSGAVAGIVSGSNANRSTIAGIKVSLSKGNKYMNTDVDGNGLAFSSMTTHRTENALAQAPNTVSAWLQLDSSWSDRGGLILGNYKDNSTACMGVEISTDGHPRFYHRNGSNQVIDLTFQNIDARGGEWCHLALVIDEGTNEVTCYKNGDVSQTLSASYDIDLSSVTNPFALGGDFRSGNEQYFKGKLLDVSLYNQPLSADDISALYLGDTPSAKAFSSYELKADNSYKTIEDTIGENDFITNARYFDKEDATDYAYSFAVVGDTQIVTENDVLNTTDNLSGIYQWILKNQESKKIEYVFGLGDITENNTEKEWALANSAISQMNNQIPYSLIRGNHDLVGANDADDPTKDYFTDTFGTDTYKNQFADGGFYSDRNIWNSWRTFKVGEVDYLLLTLDWGADDAVLRWAGNIVYTHPNHNVIVTTHAYLNSKGEPLTEDDKSEVPPTQQGGINNGDHIWDKLISKYENIVLVLSGHVPSEQVVYAQSEGNCGNTVTSMLVDPQGVDADEGSTGMVTMLYFSKDGSKMQVETYSTVHKQYFLAENQYSLTLDLVDGKRDFTVYDGEITDFSWNKGDMNINGQKNEGLATDYLQAKKVTKQTDDAETAIGCVVTDDVLTVADGVLQIPTSSSVSQNKVSDNDGAYVMEYTNKYEHQKITEFEITTTVSPASFARRPGGLVIPFYYHDDGNNAEYNPDEGYYGIGFNVSNNKLQAYYEKIGNQRAYSSNTDSTLGSNSGWISTTDVSYATFKIAYDYSDDGNTIESITATATGYNTDGTVVVGPTSKTVVTAATLSAYTNFANGDTPFTQYNASGALAGFIGGIDVTRSQIAGISVKLSEGITIENNMELTDSIALGYEMTIADGVLSNGASVSVSIDGPGDEVTTTDDTLALTNDSGKYLFQYEDIRAHELDEDITVTVQAGDVKKYHTCSVLDYLKAFLELEDTELSAKYTEEQIAALRDVAIDLVQYGDALVEYRGGNAEQYTNAISEYAAWDLNDNVIALEELRDAENSGYVSTMLNGNNTDADYKWKGIGLTLKDKVNIRVTVEAESTDGLAVAVFVGDAESLVAIIAEEAFIKKSGDQYYVYFDELMAYQYGEKVTFRFYKDNVEVDECATVTYSVNTYLYNTYNSASANDELNKLLPYINEYGWAAVSYYTANQTTAEE